MPPILETFRVSGGPPRPRPLSANVARWSVRWARIYPSLDRRECQIEVDDEGSETKKVEIYEDGRFHYAYDEIEEGTFLTGEPLTDISIFNSNEDNEILKGDEIKKKRFIIFGIV